MTDLPFDQVSAQAKALCDDGLEVHQKFTCAGCGSRLTVPEPCKFYEQGTCDQCSTVTNILMRGCGYLVVMKLRE